METLIAHLFLARELAHRAHLKATGPGSDAAHRALRDFYDEIVEKADAIAEAYGKTKGILSYIASELMDISVEFDEKDAAFVNGFVEAREFTMLME